MVLTPGIGGRDVAARVLVRVSKDGAFAAAALDAELERAAQLGPRDRAMATELVYGSLRTQPWLLEQIKRFLPRGVESVDTLVRAHLVLAAYQLYFTRVPPFAAVSEAVSAVKAARGTRVAAFANAVLRKVAARAHTLSEAERTHALVASTPDWLREALERALSADGAQAFLESGSRPPPIALRVEDASERGAWVDRLAAASPGASIEAGHVSPRAILVRGAGKPQSLPGFVDGAWTVQEEGSQVAALALGARPGEVVLDACAGRGNKTGVLARAVLPDGAVDACDANPSKLTRLAQDLGRLGLRARATLGVDWTVGSGDVSGLYDRVLVDAPCSGTGTLRRRPEIALRRESTDLPAKTRDQVAILSRAAQHVRPGGALVYVVCSVLREEAEDVLERTLAARTELTPAPFDAPEARAICGDLPSFRLLPHVHGTDGYFIAMLRRRA